MQENKNSKKKRIEHVEIVLDNPDTKNFNSKDEKYLITLSKRLKATSEKEINSKKTRTKKDTKIDADSLKPRVTIHIREKESIKKIDLTPKKEEKKPIIEKKEELKIEDDDIIEVEKIETTAPTFIEVKPKEIKIKKEKTEKKTIVEWEPVEEVTAEPETKPEEGVFEEVEEIKEIKKDKKIKIPKKEKVETEKESEGFFIEDITEEKQVIDDGTKIDAFKEIKSIDEKTAILLYNKGYTSSDDLKDITFKELSKIKGIKRKKAKQIIKEIKEKTQWQPGDLEIKKETTIGEPLEKKQISKSKKEVTPIPIEETAEIEITPEQIQKETTEDKQKIMNTFKEIKNIDEQTAKLLYNNGYTTPEKLKTITPKELKKIGIKRKKAKQIIKEIKEFNEKEKQIPPIEPSNDKLLLTKEKIPEEPVKEESKEIEGPVELNNDSFWIPIEEEAPLEKKKTKEKSKRKTKKPKLDSKKKKNIDPLMELKSIDEKTAEILLDNNIKSTDDLKKKSVKDLAKIKGIKKKVAEDIFEELNKKDEDQEEFVEFIVEDEKIQDDEIKEIENKIFNHVENSKKEKTSVFKGIKSIDEKTANLLVENGITSLDNLRSKTIKELVKIKGIKRKTAKQIKKELQELDLSKNQNFYFHKMEHNDEEVSGFRYGEYILFEKEINIGSNKKRIVRFFSKQKPNDSKPINLPEGYIVKENKNGIPYLKKYN